MNVELNRKNDTEVELTIVASKEQLDSVKQAVLKRLQPEVSAPGFRKGKVPLNIVEKHVDDNYFKSQFLDEALTEVYRTALIQEDLRPLSQPQVEIQKFVPFSDLAFKVSVSVVPPIKLGDYTKVKKSKKVTDVTAADVTEVVDNLRKRMAEKKEVKRAIKDGDEAIIDFAGVDSDGKDVAGAKGTDYPLSIGSDTFIAGFEENLTGMKAGEEKTFTLTFPKDYAHTPLANKDVTFTVTIKTVNEMELPKADDAFAKKVGNFKTLKELKDDIKVQLQKQKDQEADAQLRDEVIGEVVTKSKMTIPQVLLDESVEGLLNEFKQNLVYRGITFPEYLEQAGMTEEEYREKELLPKAETRVKTGLVLAEIAKAEKITVSDEELEIRLQLLRGQHQNDPQMMAELNKPEAQQDIASRMATEKTIEKLVEYATK